MAATHPSGTSTRPPIEEMYVVHRAFRREFSDAPSHVRSVATGDVDRARFLAEAIELLLTGLHLHHTGEDAILWPRLLERAAPSTALVETMQAQHEDVDARIGEIRAATSAWARDAAAASRDRLALLLDGFAAALFEHLDLEEREILPLCERHITAEEWSELANHGRGEMTFSQVPLMFGGVLEEATPAEKAQMMSQLPPPVRLLLRVWGFPRYRRWISRVRER